MLRNMLTFGFSWNCIHCFVCSTFRMVFNFSHISLMKVQCCTYLIISSSNRPQSFCWGTRQSITGAVSTFSSLIGEVYSKLYFAPDRSIEDNLVKTYAHQTIRRSSWDGCLCLCLFGGNSSCWNIFTTYCIPCFISWHFCVRILSILIFSFSLTLLVVEVASG